MMDDKPVPEMKVSDLVDLWDKATECDKALCAEMRTNLQIVAGQHYMSENSNFFTRIKDNKALTDLQRLRLTKNHVQRAISIYRNAIESISADVGIEPANPNELSDQKSAELNSSYWEYIKRCEEYPRKRSILAKHFVEIGECHAKIFFDLNGGQKIGYLAKMVPDPENPEKQIPELDANGAPIPTEEIDYGGTIRIMPIEGYKVKRDPGATTFAESPYIFIDTSLPINSLNSIFKDREIVEELKKSNADRSRVVFDSNTRSYKEAQDHVLLRECYWRPCPALPDGYYQYFIEGKILTKGKLPYGIFPIVSENFEDQTGNPRGYSVIRNIRPVQVEINRCASKIAEHQVTLGDDKVYIPSTAKVSQGALLPGLRHISYSGAKPEVIQGRTGDQYLGYLESQINELYQLCNLQEVNEDKQESPDLYTNLFKSMRFKKKFTIYGERFERFQIKIVETCLELAKKCCNEEELVPALGKSEYINIPEFKSSEPLAYRIAIKPRPDDIESQFGKQVTLNHIMQYVGPNLQKEEIGKIIRLSPFLNNEQMFDDFTSKYDIVINDLLALDRGQWREPRRYQDHDYIISMLSSRMSKPDYEFLPDQIKVLYEAKMRAHEQLKTMALQEIEKAKSGFIPSGGYMVACDFYVPRPDNPNSTMRLRIPSEALSWLIDKLKQQGNELDKLMQMPLGVQQDVAGQLGAPQMPPVGPGMNNEQGIR